MKKSCCKILMAGCLAAALTAGCAQADKSAETTTAGQAAQEAVSSEAAPETSAEEAASGDVYTIDFWHWSNEANANDMIADFNKKFEGKYELVYQKMADAKAMTCNTALGSGEKIDVMTQNNALNVHERVNDGVYLGLKQFLDAEGMDYADLFGESLEEIMNFDGDYYAIPYSTAPTYIWYNKNMFDAAGVEYPQDGWTWEDFRETAIKLTSGEGANKVYGAMIDVAGTFDTDFYWDMIARQKLGAATYYNKERTATAFDDPAFKESLEYFYKLMAEDQCIVPLDEYTALQYDNDQQGIIGLYNGKYAMIFVPAFALNYLQESFGIVPEGVEIGVVNVPTSDGGTPITVTYTSTCSIPASCENPQAAWEALKYACITDPIMFTGRKGMEPGVKMESDQQEEYYRQMVKDKQAIDPDEVVEFLKKDKIIVTRDNSIIAGQNGINEAMKYATSLVFNGEMSVDDALAYMKEEGDKAIAAGQ